MIKGDISRRELDEFLDKKLMEITKPEDRRKLSQKIIKEFNLDMRTIEGILTFKKNISEFSNFEVFCLMYCLCPKELGKYFTNEEIDRLKKEKKEQHTISFPIILNNMVQIADDQWVGRIDVQQLMEFRNAGILNYDENEQRVMQRIKTGKTEIFKISLNRKAVEEIKEAFESGAYISDTITLNMPLDSSDFSYSKGTLKIKELPNNMFNLLDGFHRYIAICQIYNFNPDFNYPLILQITNFSTEKANQFIYQADQKTKMSQIDSDSYNQYSMQNKIVNRLNQDPMSNIQGMIGRNDAKISFQVLADLIKYYYIGSNTKNDMRTMNKIKTELQKKFNILTDQDPKYLDMKYSTKQLYIIMHVFASEVKLEDYSKAIDYLMTATQDHNVRLFEVSNPTKRKTRKELDKKLEEWQHVQ